eukprot:CAMPEP_0197724308 /NCGR_PEP_ID=MMETSP1434-20131217/6278_1 /TAXON_ID=265543 /ORGANISM="Minutocellus polymorphus, Strain CCMP3303" /LENGTH=326 /DNA_ID=CAMNT_0043309649 /DNA_START=21 /DNA_END=998 /DNA_ORIENTATION=+
MTSQGEAEAAPDTSGLESYRFLVPQQADGDQDEPSAATTMAVNFGGEGADAGFDGNATNQYINQFGQMARSTSSKLFRGSDGSVNSLASLGQMTLSEKNTSSGQPEQDEKKETDSVAGDAQMPTKHDVVNQFGCVQRVESCVLFGVKDQQVLEGDTKEAATKDAADDQAEVAVKFGEDESRQEGGPPKGRYLNQFGEATRRTSYKLFRGGNGSVTSLSSLVNVGGGSELGSSLGSVCELSAMDDGHDGAASSTDEVKRAPIEEVTNQFGAIARVESAALFRSESANSLALSATAHPPTNAPEDLTATSFDRALGTAPFPNNFVDVP